MELLPGSGAVGPGRALAGRQPATPRSGHRPMTHAEYGAQIKQRRSQTETTPARRREARCARQDARGPRGPATAKMCAEEQSTVSVTKYRLNRRSADLVRPYRTSISLLSVCDATRHIAHLAHRGCVAWVFVLGALLALRDAHTARIHEIHDSTRGGLGLSVLHV